MADGKRSIESQLGNVKQDYAEAHARVQKAQQERDKMDQTLRGLNDEVVH